MKCYLYARFSPRPDAATSESVDTQLRDLREAAVKRNWTIAGEFSDPDMKGDDEERPGLWEAMEALKKGYVLFAWKGDRLARSVYLSELLHREAKEKGATIEYLHGRNGDSPDDVLLRQIISAIDEHRKKVDAVRTRLMMQSLQRNGRSMSSRPPYGFDLKERGWHAKRNKPLLVLVPNPDEQQIVTIIRERYQSGVDPKAIVRQFNEEGLKCRGRPWDGRTLQRVLRNFS